ncbi:hypothetical protein HY994_00020 [Candidatus Micrarchaeota archaeon]|nr:hypothetical protein [Candidatus Micrarchaeota archaeon]
MPHKCVRCSTVYPNNSPELMRGCSCGSRVFLFLRDPNAQAPVFKPSTSAVKDTVASFFPASSNPPALSGSSSAPALPSSAQTPAPSKTAEETSSDSIDSSDSDLRPSGTSRPLPATPDPLVSDYGWLEDELAFLSKDKPVSVDVDAVENLRILEKGAYEIDLPSLFKGEPLVIKSDQHVYYVKLPHPRA